MPNGSVAERADERADRDEQADVRVVDVQLFDELRRRGAHRRGVGAAQPEDRGEDDDHARPFLASERDRQAPREGARRGGAEGGCVGEDACGTRLVGAHVPMVAGAAAPATSDVAADEEYGRDRERGSAVAGEEEAAGERR